ncbi:MAG: hypothetical protein GKS06_16885 [Acidobacteria bacterium]|nr:hypothetical protein [Acidobacteriota bacterium]
MHFDHAAGTTFTDADGELALRYPNAVHHVQSAHWDWAWSPTLKDAGSFRREDFGKLASSPKLCLVDGEVEIAPSIKVFPLDGHTRAMQAVRIGSPGADLLFTADLVPTAAHLRWPYIMGFDNEPLTTLAEKQHWLSQAALGGTVLVFEHDPVIAAARLVENDRGGVQVGEQVSL